MGNKTESWKVDYQEQLDRMPNTDLLEEVINMASGDVRDGLFTNRGATEFDMAQNTLNKRLGPWLKEN